MLCLAHVLASRTIWSTAIVYLFPSLLYLSLLHLCDFAVYVFCFTTWVVNKYREAVPVLCATCVGKKKKGVKWGNRKEKNKKWLGGQASSEQWMEKKMKKERKMSVPDNRLGGRDGKVKLGFRRYCFRHWLSLHFVCSLLFFFFVSNRTTYLAEYTRDPLKAETGVLHDSVLLCLLTNCAFCPAWAFGTLRRHRMGAQAARRIAAAFHAFACRFCLAPFRPLSFVCLYAASLTLSVQL